MDQDDKAYNGLALSILAFLQLLPVVEKKKWSQQEWEIFGQETNVQASLKSSLSKKTTPPQNKQKPPSPIQTTGCSCAIECFKNAFELILRYINLQ